MQKVLTFSLMALLAGCGSDRQNSRLQGTPDQDPVVNQYRLFFQMSQAPSEQDLNLGSAWNCSYRSAFKNDWRQGQATYVFSAQVDRIINYGSGSIKDFVLGMQGLAGAVEKYKLVLRKDQHGNLVGEWNVGKGLFPSWYSVASIAEPTRRAYGYEYCTPANPNTNSPR